MLSKSAASHFNCPHCDALYQIVKVEAGPETVTDDWVTCRNCAGALPAAKGIPSSNIFFCGSRSALVDGRG